MDIEARPQRAWQLALCPEDRNEDSRCKGKRETGSYFYLTPKSICDLKTIDNFGMDLCDQ